MSLIERVEEETAVTARHKGTSGHSVSSTGIRSEYKREEKERERRE